MLTEAQAVQEIKAIGLDAEQEAMVLRFMDEVVNSQDLDLFIRYIELRELAKNVKEKIREQGTIVEGPRGGVKVHPGVALMERLSRLAERLHKRLNVAGLKMAGL